MINFFSGTLYKFRKPNIKYHDFKNSDFQQIKVLKSFQAYINERVEKLNDLEDDELISKEIEEMKQMLSDSDDNRILFEWIKQQILNVQEYSKKYDLAIKFINRLQDLLFKDGSKKLGLANMYNEGLQRNLANHETIGTYIYSLRFNFF
jgi:hypothetical protein